jgi:hypothetical protein
MKVYENSKKTIGRVHSSQHLQASAREAIRTSLHALHALSELDPRIGLLSSHRHGIVHIMMLASWAQRALHRITGVVLNAAAKAAAKWAAEEPTSNHCPGTVLESTLLLLQTLKQIT